MSAIASLTAPVAVKAGKSAAFSRGARVSQVRADSRTPRGFPSTGHVAKTSSAVSRSGIARVRGLDARATAPNAAVRVDLPGCPSRRDRSRVPTSFLRTLREVARPEDFVVVKLDVDYEDAFDIVGVLATARLARRRRFSDEEW